jgi:hypothetical protein
MAHAAPPDPTPEITYGKNYKEAVFSFFRVLCPALATAVLPYILAGKNGDPIHLRPILVAVAASFLLTVVNFFRPGEVRFGASTPNVKRPE